MGKCFPRWADLDQASSGEPEPPEEVAVVELEMGEWGDGEPVTVVIWWIICGLVVGPLGFQLERGFNVFRVEHGRRRRRRRR